MQRPLPPTYANDEGNMINVWRKDGIRPFLFSTHMEDYNAEKVQNYILAQLDTHYIDFIIYHAPQKDFYLVARKLGIAAFSQHGDGEQSRYDRLCKQIASSGATHVALFYGRHYYLDERRYPDSLEYIADYFTNRSIPVEWIEW